MGIGRIARHGRRRRRVVNHISLHALHQSLVILLALLVSGGANALTNRCNLTLHIYDSGSGCDQTPSSVSDIIADGMCRHNKENDGPGYYKAHCIDGTLFFTASGCSSDTCMTCPEGIDEVFSSSSLAGRYALRSEGFFSPPVSECFQFRNSRGWVLAQMLFVGGCSNNCHGPTFPLTTGEVAVFPTGDPTTLSPTNYPTNAPTSGPTDVPSDRPSSGPSFLPTSAHSSSPSHRHSSVPSVAHSSVPSVSPSAKSTTSRDPAYSCSSARPYKDIGVTRTMCDFSTAFVSASSAFEMVLDAVNLHAAERNRHMKEKRKKGGFLELIGDAADQFFFFAPFLGLPTSDGRQYAMLVELRYGIEEINYKISELADQIAIGFDSLSVDLKSWAVYTQLTNDEVELGETYNSYTKYFACLQNGEASCISARKEFRDNCNSHSVRDPHFFFRQWYGHSCTICSRLEFDRRNSTRVNPFIESAKASSEADFGASFRSGFMRILVSTLTEALYLEMVCLPVCEDGNCNKVTNRFDDVEWQGRIQRMIQAYFDVAQTLHAAYLEISRTSPPTPSPSASAAHTEKWTKGKIAGLSVGVWVGVFIAVIVCYVLV